VHTGQHYDPAAIRLAMERLLAGQWKKGGIHELWDGHAAERIVEVLRGPSVHKFSKRD